MTTLTMDSIHTNCIAQTTITTPLGRILLACTAKGLAGAWFEGQKHHPGPIAALLAPHARAEPLIERLCELQGIGPWTAHYIAMRALGWPDAFPPNDVAVLKAMKQLFGTGSQREADVHAQAWQPWRAYAVLRLWNTLEKSR